MTDTSLVSRHLSPARAATLILALFLAELAAIGVIFKHGIDFTCLDNWPQMACRGASGTMVAIYCMLGALLLFGILRPAPLRDLVRQAGQRMWPLAVNLAGLLVAMVPVSFMQEGAGPAMLLPAFAFWSAGMALLLAGVALHLAPLPRWRAFFADNWTWLLPVLATGALAPSVATLIRPLWSLEGIAGTTFTAVAWALEALGYRPEIDTSDKVIGMDGFYIDVAPVCSGIEGMALVTLFVTLYLVLFRADLRFPRALLLYPVGIAASALFNVVRITVLLVIGIEGNPELAVGGFHSHAGWLLFTLIAVGIVVAAHAVPALQKHRPGPDVAAGHGAPPPFFRDPVVARILPFAVFMFSALLAQAFSNSPGVVYPLRALAMTAAVLAFWPIYARLDWRVDPVAFGAGAVIGIGWVLIPYAPEDTTPAYGTLSGAALIGWMLARGAGTVLLVPLIEELFFRDYLEGRLRRWAGSVWAGSIWAGPVLAALVTAGLFAVLHDRWAEAFAAGLILSWVMRRQGRVTDAILAHGVANLIVFAAAFALGRMYII